MFRIALFDLNQWALDFQGNTKRILATIDEANKAGAAYRVGPELEICGYSLDDSFYELDTIELSWICLSEIIKKSKQCNELIIDVGMPVRQNSSLYNCRVVLFDGRILFIRAKTRLAKDGNYRENRYFNAWDDRLGSTLFRLPVDIAQLTGQVSVIFGSDFILELPSSNRLDSALNHNENLRIGYEICQELWEPQNTSSKLFSQHGCHLVVNSSASYWQLRKLKTVQTFIKDITSRCGGCYALCNMLGCDGQRVVFYGQSNVHLNGKRYETCEKSKADIETNLFNDYNIVLFDLDIKEIEQYRSQSAISITNVESTFIDLESFYRDESSRGFFKDASTCRLFLNKALFRNHQSNRIIRKNHWDFEQEISCYVSLWLWDYLRRSGLKGFIIPLSGGLDSSSVAVIVFCLCNIIYRDLSKNKNMQEFFIKRHNLSLEMQLKSIKSAQDISKLILRCVYISTQYSGEDTLRRAESLSREIGAPFKQFKLNDLYSKMRTSLNQVRFEDSLNDSISPNDNEVSLLDQNLQARLRMVTTYFLSGGQRIVLATGNVDEALVGYMTKYDCSAADINPIGGICKSDLKQFMIYCANVAFSSKNDFRLTVLDIVAAPPSAELTGADQRDEDEIGLTYDEIQILGSTRRGNLGCFGPTNMFRHIWARKNQVPYNEKIRCFANCNNNNSKSDEKSIALQLSRIIKLFFVRYSRNRHKLTTLTPALHAETYSPDDNRFDHRQFLYNTNWDLQFKLIDDLVNTII